MRNREVGLHIQRVGDISFGVDMCILTAQPGIDIGGQGGIYILAIGSEEDTIHRDLTDIQAIGSQTYQSIDQADILPLNFPRCRSGGIRFVVRR